MCEAITGISLATSVAIASVTATVAGAGLSYMASQQAAAATKRQQDYNAQVADNNQVLADRAAKDALARGATADQQKANATNALLGRQRTAFAANGVDANSGSAVDLESDTSAAGQLDQLNIQASSQREAAGFQQQSLNYGDQAKLDEAAGQDALDAGNLKGASTLIGGAGQVASSWYNYQYGTRQRGVSP